MFRFRLSALLFALCLPGGLAGQTVVGRVLDETTGRLLAQADVAVLPSTFDSVLVSTVATDGTFRIPLTGPGEFRLRVRSLGYTTVTTTPVIVPPDAVVTVEVRLAVDAIPLQPLRVVAERVEPVYMREFRERQRLGFGKFLSREDLEYRPGASLEDVLRGVQGVRINKDLIAGGRPIPRVEMRGAMIADNCYAALFVDGVRQYSSDRRLSSNLDTARIEDFWLIDPDDIEAIEVYRGLAEVPGIYAGNAPRCGVVAVWLRRRLERGIAGPLAATATMGHDRLLSGNDRFREHAHTDGV